MGKCPITCANTLLFLLNLLLMLIGDESNHIVSHQTVLVLFVILTRIYPLFHIFRIFHLKNVAWGKLAL